MFQSIRMIFTENFRLFVKAILEKVFADFVGRLKIRLFRETMKIERRLQISNHQCIAMRCNA